MALLNILQYPDLRLKKIASPVVLEDLASDHIQEIIENLFATMRQAKGIGLAAIQVNIPLQILTIDLNDPNYPPICAINPFIVHKQEPFLFTEGCLSFPGIYTKIKRYKQIKVEFLDRHGNQQLLTANDLLSVCFQHEIDHLNGKTFFDHLSPLKKRLLENKLNKLRARNL